MSSPELDLRGIVAQVVHGRGTVEAAAIEIVRHADAYVARGEDADSRPVREVRARWYRLRDEIGALLDGLAHVVSPMRVAHEGRLLVTAADLLSGDLAGAAAAVVASRLGELDAKDGEVEFLSLALERFPPLSPDAMHLMRTRVQRLGALHRDSDAIDAATTYHDRAGEKASTGDQAEALLLRSLARVSDRQATLALEDIRSGTTLRAAAAEVPTWVSPLSDYLIELGRQERGAGHVEAAFVAFDRGRRVARDDEHDAVRSVVHLSEIGITWEVVGDLERSARVLDQAVREALAAGHPELAARWGGTADPDAPEPPGGAAQLGHLARLLAAPSRDLDRIRRGTLELIRRSVEGGGRELEMQARNLLGRVYAAGGRWAQAEAALLEAAAMSEELGLRLMTFHLWTNLGNLYLQCGRRDAAEDALRRAAAVGEMVREESQGTELRQSLGAGLARCYQQLAFWAHNTFVPSGSNDPQLPVPAAAFDVGTRARAHNFNAWLRTSLVLDEARNDASRRAVERLRQAEVALEAASDASSILAPELVRQRQEAHDACRALGIDPVALARQPGEARSLPQWQRELAAGDLAVVLCSLPDGIGALAITPTAAACRYLPFPRDDRLRLLRELREASWNFVEYDDGDVPGPAHQTARAAQAMVDHVRERLGERLFSPIVALASGMGAVRRLLVVPHDELFLVPWARLQEMLGATRLSCLPSTEALTLLRKRERSGRQPWVAFGDATGELDGATREVGSLAGFHVDTPTRAAVLEALPAAGLAHFAGHGVHDAVNEYRTGLVLLDASAPGGEDVLTVADVSALVSMREAHLVVLSACDSGLPRVHPASEFTSLPGAFLVAGARNVVASLWPAHDVAASLFMRAFYDALMKDDVAKGSVSSALATARRSLAAMSYEDAVAISGDAEVIPRRPKPFDHPVYLDTFQHYGVD